MKRLGFKRAMAGIAGAVLAMSAVGCAPSTTGNGEEGQLSIVATTGYLGDAARNIAPDADVTVLVKPGGDPHTQPLTTRDTEKLDSADVVLWTSRDMEHQMMDQLDKLGDKQLAAAGQLDESELLPWEEDGKIEGHDPHVWNSPDLWKQVVQASAEKIGEIDPENADQYTTNAEEYNKKIDAVAADAKEKLERIPKENRVLVTGHDLRHGNLRNRLRVIRIRNVGC